MVTTAHNRVLGGYQGPALSYQYFGTWMVVVVLGGVAVWRHDRRLWLFGAIAVISAVLSFGTRPDIWLPWQALQHLPLLENVVPYRLVLVTYLAVAVMLGLIVEHVYVSVNRRRRSAPLAGAERASGLDPTARWTGAGAAAVVAVVALVQPASYLAQTIPMTTVPVAVPTWFTAVAPHLPRHQVLLIIPAPFTSFDNSMTWQALDKMDFSMVGEGGPGGMLVETGTELTGAQVIAKISSQTPRARTLTADGVAEVRQALHDWRVTMVVIPDQPGLPAYDQIHSVTLAAALITAATGRLPVHQADAWVWTGVGARRCRRPTRRRARLAECTKAVAPRGAGAVRRATACVLASPGTSHPALRREHPS